MRIIVDDREPPDMALMLEKKGVDVKVERLQSGDYYFMVKGETWAFERKTRKDFQGSWWSNRLDEQVANMIEIYDRPCLIFEEEDTDFFVGDYWKVKAHVQTLNFQIPVIRTSSMKNTATQLYHVCKQAHEGKIQYVRVTPKVVKADTDVEKLYAAMPGISLVRAKAIAKVYPSMAELVKAVSKTHVYKDKWKTKKRWREKRWDANVEGFGDKLAEKIGGFLLYGN